MKFTDRYFKFPVRAYDTELTKAIIKEEKMIEKMIESSKDDALDDFQLTKNLPWVSLTHSVLPKDILGWSESFSREYSVDDIIKMGKGNITMVELKDYGTIGCQWPIDEFEKNLDKWWSEWNEKNAANSINSIK